jgi:hypothetical protein
MTPVLRAEEEYGDDVGVIDCCCIQYEPAV